MARTLQFDKKRFFKGLQTFFSRHGYTYLPAQNMFYSPTANGFKAIYVIPSVYPDEVYFEVNLGVRLDIVERTIRPFTLNPQSFQTQSTTAITSLGRLLDQPTFKLQAQTDDQIKRVHGFLKDCMNDKGFHFLDSMTHVEHLDRLLNNDPERASDVAFNQVLRCFRGIIVARLRGNPSWLNIHHQYLEYLEKQRVPSTVYQNYMRLIGYLDSFGLN
ncbi:MAG: hypothetical protein LPK80_02965 [Bacteroidota bacterium]|nr:hypothetical protein [Bacteroidota bacterium]MDX5427346.1 hypothetical protein [Bacteroidota bacterium]MDX5447164.1 hypothetical protein [Bacteroidota bacterium]MDX5505297.1 hypothetical protein [Bacteroidota bacterium]